MSIPAAAPQKQEITILVSLTTERKVLLQILLSSEMKAHVEMDSENARTVADKMLQLADIGDGIPPPLKAKP